MAEEDASMTISGAQRLPVNVFENPEELVIVAAMPGIEPEDINVELKGSLLFIASGARGLDADKKYIEREWSYGPYEREIQLKAPVDGRKANATYGNGVLTIVLPKAERFVDTKIEIPKVG